jgi:hypothetical protein
VYMVRDQVHCAPRIEIPKDELLHMLYVRRKEQFVNEA